MYFGLHLMQAWKDACCSLFLSSKKDKHAKKLQKLFMPYTKVLTNFTHTCKDTAENTHTNPLHLQAQKLEEQQLQQETLKKLHMAAHSLQQVKDQRFFIANSLRSFIDYLLY